jgi:transketolase
MEFLQNLRNIREKILLVCAKAKEGHIPSSLSVLDILWCLYDSVLNIDPFDEHRDIFILSKGHAAIGLYVVLAHKGLIPKSSLEDFAKFDSMLGGHPDRNKVKYVEASTGSLGHGFPMAVGAALAKKINNLKGSVYVLVGDGECNEGSVWESVLLASGRKLGNLCCIVDNNHSTDRALPIDPIGAKFQSFGWEVVEVDGHDHEHIKKALNQFKTVAGSKPFCIVANTIKGKGIKSLENNPEWNHKTPSEQELASLLKQIYE